MKRKADICIGTIKKLGNLMNFTGESEELIEAERQNLCRILQFEPFAAF